METQKINSIPSFDRKAFVKAAFPSYFFPMVMSFTGGYFSNNQTLMKASYSTIALPSLLVTILCFVLLWQFQKRQLFIMHRLLMAFFLSVLMIVLALFVIWLCNLQAFMYDILPSTLIGVVLLSLMKPLKKIETSNEN